MKSFSKKSVESFSNHEIFDISFYISFLIAQEKHFFFSLRKKRVAILHYIKMSQTVFISRKDFIWQLKKEKNNNKIKNLFVVCCSFSNLELKYFSRKQYKNILYFWSCIKFLNQMLQNFWTFKLFLTEFLCVIAFII